MAKGAVRQIRRSKAIEQERRALKLRLAGKSHEDIGRALGVTRSRATQILNAALAKRRQERDEAADALLDLELAKLDQMERELVPLIVGQVRKIKADLAAYEVKMAEWEAAVEAAKEAGNDPPRMPKLRQPWTLNDILLAVDRNLKLGERRAKLLGLDNPKPAEVDIGDGLDPVVAGRLMAAFAREAGIGDGPSVDAPPDPQQPDAGQAPAQ